MEFANEKHEASDPAGPTYRAFLLRCWQEVESGPSKRTAWRFRLMEPGNRETECGFANLEALLAYLRREFETG